jgi:cellulose 1,4-beta-cellobiosidase
MSGDVAVKMNAIANTSTAVWFPTIASIAGENGSMGLRAHLDRALDEAQSAQSTVVFTMVLSNLPNRNCDSASFPRELTVAAGGIEIYKTQYIDAITSILKDSKYSALRIAVIIEPNSIVNLVTDVGHDAPMCDEAASSGAYAKCIQYAINQLHPLSNAYLYADIARSGRLGWALAMSPSSAVSIYYDILSHTDAGVYGIDGLVSNVSDYIPTKEPFLPNPDLYVGVAYAWDGVTGGPIKSASFYSWNSYLDEGSYAKAFRSGLISAGFPSSLSCIIDTGRNGWGGPLRPTQLTAPADLSTIDPVTYINNNKVDRRTERWHGCNQSGAGIGERPRIWPSVDIAAYVWIKPPGESDGTYDPNAVSDPSLANQECLPSIEGAPAAGEWFNAQFQQLVENAYPPIE